MSRVITMSRAEADSAAEAFGDAFRQAVRVDLRDALASDKPLAEVVQLRDKIRKQEEPAVPLSGPVVVNANNNTWSLTPLSEIDDTPIQWAVGDIIPQHGMSVIFGKPKSGKSFVAIDMACCIATGTPYHGHSVKPGKVVYIAGEGRYGIRARFASWAEYNGADPMENVLLSSGPTMINPNGVAAIIPVIRQASGGAPAMIVIDTLKRNFHGDENTQKDMQAFVAGCDRIREFFPDTAIVIVHHSGHGNEDRAMGSINLLASVDAEHRVTRAANGNINLDCTAMKDAAEPDAMAFELVTVGASLVPVHAGTPKKTKPAGVAVKVDGQLALDAWVAVQEFCGPEGMEEAPWRDEFNRLKGGSAEANRQAWGRAKKQLIAAGILNQMEAPYILTLPGVTSVT